MVSPERCLEYCALPPEPDSFKKAPEGWPSKGDIQFNHLSLFYPGTEEAILKNITLHIPAGTKVGIVGRTGAGKSSLLHALFRLVEPSGSILIDGISTFSLGLHSLRSSLCIIPQDPFCFKGTLRFNIDPFSIYSDDQIWKALEAVELKQTVAKNKLKLQAVVTENGSNWSFGERQLICIARAILKNTRFIVMVRMGLILNRMKPLQQWI